jgi:hypothetical protein
VSRAWIERSLTVAVALILAVSTTPAWAQNFGGSPAPWFHVTWNNRGYGSVPTIEGYVQNASPFRVTNVRLQIDGLDGGGRSVAQAFGWTFGDIAPGDRGYFTAPAIPGATAYQISVASFDVISSGGP